MTGQLIALQFDLSNSADLPFDDVDPHTPKVAESQPIDMDTGEDDLEQARRLA